MADYISREAAVETLRRYKIDPFKLGFLDDNIDGFNEGIDTAISCIGVEVPAADVRPVVRGRWEPSTEISEAVDCSVCGFRTVYGAMPDGSGRDYNFYPNCGADMGGGDAVNRQQRRQAAKHKGAGQNYADVLAKRQIGKETLRMAMEDQAVALAADIICRRQLWGVVIALNEVFQFGPKRTRQFFEAMEAVTDDFEAMRKDHGDDYAEEKLRQRAEKVSGVKIRYQHEVEREAWEEMKAQTANEEDTHARDHEDAARPAEASDR